MKAVVTVDVNPKYARIALELAGYDVREKSNEEICKMAIQMNDCYAVKTKQIDIENSIDNERKEGEIELVIKMPEEIYKASQIIDDKYEDASTIQIPLEVIARGTPLPKGHGRLKDIDKLPVNEIERTEYNYECGENECHSEEIVYLDDIISAETIVEADTQNKEKEDFEEERDI